MKPAHGVIVFAHAWTFAEISSHSFSPPSLQVSTTVALYLNNNTARTVIDSSERKQDNDCAWKWSALQVKAPSGKQAEDLCSGVPCLTGWQGRRMAQPISAHFWVVIDEPFGEWLYPALSLEQQIGGSLCVFELRRSAEELCACCSCRNRKWRFIRITRVVKTRPGEFLYREYSSVLCKRCFKLQGNV